MPLVTFFLLISINSAAIRILTTLLNEFACEAALAAYGDIVKSVGISFSQLVKRAKTRRWAYRLGIFSKETLRYFRYQAGVPNLMGLTRS
jgi:hypothetical protein